MKWSRILILLIYLLSSISAVHAKIKIGTVQFDPPYVLSLDQGFEIELIKLICNKMKEECEIIPMPYSSLFTSLKEGQIDLAIDSIPFYIDSNGSDNGFIFSYPYALSSGQFLILKNNTITSIDELPQGSKVGLVRESTATNEAIFYDYFTSKYGSKFQPVLFDDIESLIADLSNEKVNAVFLDNFEAKYWMLNGGDKFKTLGKMMKIADGLGIMSIEKNRPLINNINEELKKIEDEKVYIDLYNTYLNMGS